MQMFNVKHTRARARVGSLIKYSINNVCMCVCISGVLQLISPQYTVYIRAFNDENRDEFTTTTTTTAHCYIYFINELLYNM